MTTPGYDGSIKIDTSIDTGGFNKDAKGMSATLKSITSSVSDAMQRLSGSVSSRFESLKNTLSGVRSRLTEGSTGISGFLVRMREISFTVAKVVAVLAILAAAILLLRGRLGFVGTAFDSLRQKVGAFVSRVTSSAVPAMKNVGAAVNKAVPTSTFLAGVKLFVDSFIKIKGAANGAGNEVRSFGGGSNALTGIFDRLKSSILGLAASLGVFFGLRELIAFGKDAVDAASSAASAFLGLQSIIDGQGRSFSDAKKYLNDYISDGLIPATDAVAAYKNLASRGYSDEQIRKTLEALKNSAAFGRQGSLSIGEAVKGATEGLKNENSVLVDNAGVTKNVSIIWKEYADSLGTTVAALTKEQKIQAEVNGIQAETKFQMGDAAKLADSYAGRVAALGVSFNNLKVAIGNSIIPVISSVLPFIKAAIDSLVVFFNQVAQVMSIFFGVSLDNVATQASDAADAMDSLNQSTEEAGKTAEGALAGFDKLDVLKKDDKSSTDAAKTTSPVKVPLEPVVQDSALEELKKKVLDFKDKLIKFLTPTWEALQRLWEKLEPLRKLAWEGLQWAWENILKPLGEWTFKELLPKFLDLLGSMLEAVGKTIEKNKPFFKDLWERFLKPAAEWTGGAIISALEWLKKWIDENPEKFVIFSLILAGIGVAFLVVSGIIALLIPIIGVIITVVGLFGGALGTVIAVIAIIVGSILLWIGIIVNLVIWFNVAKLAAEIAWVYIQRVWAVAWQWFQVNVVDKLRELFSQLWAKVQLLTSAAWLAVTVAWAVAQAWFQVNVVDKLREVFTKLWELPGKLASTAWAAVTVVWAAAGAWFQTAFVVPASQAFNQFKEMVATNATAAWNSFTNNLSGIANWLRTNVTNPLQSAFSTALSRVDSFFRDTFNGIRDFMRGVVNSVIEMLNGMLGGAIDGINSLIDSLNSAGSLTPGWNNIPALGGYQIPYLATGAVIPPNSQFLAMLGDQKSGTNIEAPEALIRKIVAEESAKSSQHVTVSFEGTLGPLVRELMPKIKVETRREGGSLATGGVY